MQKKKPTITSNCDQHLPTVVKAVAQAEYLHDLYVTKSTVPNAGRGLFALKGITKGDFIGEYTGTRQKLAPTIPVAGDEIIGSNELTMVEFDLRNGTPASLSIIVVTNSFRLGHICKRQSLYGLLYKL